MKGSYIEEVAIHGGPELCGGVPRGRSEALDRGARRPAIEPRNWCVWGADAVSCDGRQHRWWRYTRAVSGPHGVGEPVHVCDLSMFENREVPRSPACGDGRAGRAGNVEAVIP